MKERLKSFAKSVPAIMSLRKALLKTKFQLTDIRDSYLSRSLAPKATPYGFSLVGSTSIHHRAMQLGEFEPEETALFSQLFKETDVFVDVGANVGFYACLARSKGLHVVAVEPMAKNLAHLYQNLRANDWEDVEVFPVGLSDRSGIATLFGASSTGASLISTWAGSSPAFHRTIALSTLDILLGDRFSDQRLCIKIDVEGAEYSALLGAVNTIGMSPRPIWLIEICLSEYHPDGLNPWFAATFELFLGLGYEARTADSRDMLVTREDVSRWVREGRAQSGTINYIFRQARGLPVDAAG